MSAKLPISSSQRYLLDSQIDYRTLSIMTLYSNHDTTTLEEGYEIINRYLYRNKITTNKEEVEALTQNKLNTILKNIRKLSKLDNRLVTYKSTPNGIVYYINYTNIQGREYVTIPEDMLRYLINVGNSNLIKTYILLKYLCGNKSKIITREFIAENIGLSSKSHSNLQTISDITHALESTGFIKKEFVFMRHIEGDKEVTKKSISYEVVPYSVWKLTH